MFNVGLPDSMQDYFKLTPTNLLKIVFRRQETSGKYLILQGKKILADFR